MAYPTELRAPFPALHTHWYTPHCTMHCSDCSPLLTRWVMVCKIFLQFADSRTAKSEYFQIVKIVKCTLIVCYVVNRMRHFKWAWKEFRSSELTTGIGKPGIRRLSKPFSLGDSFGGTGHSVRGASFEDAAVGDSAVEEAAVGGSVVRRPCRSKPYSWEPYNWTPASEASRRLLDSQSN